MNRERKKQKPKNPTDIHERVDNYNKKSRKWHLKKM